MAEVGTTAPGPARVLLREVGPRDGLQNEDARIPVDVKVRFIELLARSGVPYVEATSFVNPRWIPQLADAEEVFARVRHLQGPDLRLVCLVPNLRGYERARAVGVTDIALFTAASESFARKNTNASIAETLARFAAVAAPARADGVSLRGYISTSFGCPYEGDVPPAEVVRLVRALDDLGCDEIVLGDTIGSATPDETARVVEAALEALGAERLALHMHDTHGRALDNIEAAWRLGIARFDSAAAGLGGCPYAPGAPGNVSTERVLERFARLGVDTGVDPLAVAEAGHFIRHAVTGHAAP